jgi:hypothetical protein
LMLSAEGYEESIVGELICIRTQNKWERKANAMRMEKGKEKCLVRGFMCLPYTFCSASALMVLSERMSKV